MSEIPRASEMTKEELTDLLQYLVNATQLVWDARDKNKTNHNQHKQQ